MSALKEFTAQLKTKGVASMAHFSVLFNTPASFSSSTDLQSLLLYCHSAPLPGLNINTTPNLSYGDNYEVPYEKMYGPAELSFYVDSDLQVKDYFDKWIQSISDPVTRNLRFYNDYTTDINIIVQNKNNKNDRNLNDFPLVSKHWITGNPVFRITIRKNKISLNTLKFVDGKKPTGLQQKLFKEIFAWFGDYVYDNKKERIVHEWKQGDLLIADIFKLAHAVTGGFKPEEREFIGMWGYKEPFL